MRCHFGIRHVKSLVSCLHLLGFLLAHSFAPLMSFDKENALPFAESSSLSTNGDSCTKKRQRQPTDACEPSFEEEGRCKTRRVDPDRLAERLPLDLVKEMDAHIFPGAKMPVFEVRKSMQERYSVDRRNIYDYFHSRGM